MDYKFKYEPKPDDNLKANHYQKRSENVSDFEKFEEFKTWYHNQMQKQENRCYYCGIEEEKLQEIVMTGILKSGRFPKDGQTSRGRGRGKWFEVDRKDPNKNYSPSNCVLACYFCNNDKSDIFGSEEYKAFMENRKGYLEQVLKKAGKE